MRRAHFRKPIVALGLWAMALASHAVADEQTAATLESIREAYGDGNYRHAAGLLNDLKKSEKEFSAAERLKYWDLCADVSLESGLLDVAQRAARTYLALVRQTASASDPEKSTVEQAALVRLARIEQSYSPVESKRALRDKVAIVHWNRARNSLAEALSVDGGLRSADPIWGAETRLQLAKTLELLGREEEARREYAAASAAAATAANHLTATPETVAAVRRVADVIRNSRVADDRYAAIRQAETAANLIEKQLAVVDVPAGDRVKLLVSAAKCDRQLKDVVRESAALTEALRTAEESGQVEPVQQAEMMVRLAELADANSDRIMPPAAIDRYHQAARLYARILADGRAARPGPAAMYRRSTPGQQAQCLVELQTIYTRLDEWDNAIAVAEDLLQVRSQSLLSAGDPNYYRAKSSVGYLYAKAARSALARSAEEVRDFSTARQAAMKAQAHLRDAVEMWRSYRPLSASDLAATLNYYAEALRYSSEFRRAGELLEEAEPYFATGYESNSLPYGEYHSNRGAVLAALGMFQPALVSYQAAIAAASSSGPRGELRARGQLLAFVYLNVAQLFKSQGQFADARSACTLAGAEAEKWLAVADRAPFLLADAALGIAEAESVYRQIDVGIQSRDAKRLAAEQLQTVRNALDAAIAATQMVLNAPISADALNADSARHLQALAMFRRHVLLESPAQDVTAAQRLWEQLADAPRVVGDLPSDLLRVRALNSLAAIALRAAAELRARARGAAGEARAAELVKQGNEQLAEAERRSAAAQQLAEKIVAYPAVRFQALLTRAQVLNAESQIRRAAAKRFRATDETQLADDSDRAARAASDQAIAALRSAITLVELPRAMTIGGEEQRAAYFAQFEPGFDLLVDLLMERGEFREALAVSEQRRSRTFMDQLRIAGVDLDGTVSEADRHIVEEVRAARDAYYTCLAQLVGAGTQGAGTADLAAELAELQGQLVNAEERVRSASTVYRQVLAAPPGREIPLEGLLAHRDLALVYYIGSEKGYVFECGAKEGIRGTPLTISSGRARRLGLPAASADDSTDERPLRAVDVAKLVPRFALDVSRPPVGAAASRGADLRMVSSAKIRPQDLALVTEILMPQEVRKRIVHSGCRHVLIVPDGALEQLAFESLPLDADRTTYLLDAFPPVCYSPSLQIYRQLVERAGGQVGEATLVSVANPSYRETGGGERQVSPRDLSPLEQEFFHYFGANVLPRLPATQTESDRVQRAFEKLRPRAGDVIVLTGDKATEDGLKDVLRGVAAAERHVGFLHVAAHGLVDQRYNNLFGAVALAPPSQPTAADDGFLTLYEVMKLPLTGCDLAVLSACETNCGPENALESGSTMARAFFCAGARRVVCTQWKVNDAATADLVADFMDRVASDAADGRAIDYARALYDAKRRLRPRAATSSPYFWAPLVLIGPPTGEAGGGRSRLATDFD